ncbi:hypothetical protein BKA01_007840 [Pseudonocardia eucalypti]|nr:hypothetical protein [Pseudonocardia eucalypti]
MGPAPDLMSDAELYARLDSVSDIKAELSRANPARLQRIYADVRLELVYDPDAKAVDASIRPLGGVVPVSEGGLGNVEVAHPRKTSVHAANPSAEPYSRGATATVGSL